MEGERFGDEGGDEIGVEFAVEEGKVLPGLAHEGALIGPDLELGEGVEVVEHGGDVTFRLLNRLI